MLRAIKTPFGIKTGFSGGFQIDYEKLVENLGLEQALILRAVIDEKWRVSGGPGEKPKVRLAADAASGVAHLNGEPVTVLSDADILANV